MDIKGFNQLSDDIKEKLKEFLLYKPMGVNLLLDEVQNSIISNIESGKSRFRRLKEEINNKYPEGSLMRNYIDGTAYNLFSNALELYFIGNNSALFIELHGLLERFCIDRACSFLAVNKRSEAILRDSFNKKTLGDISSYFLEISLWTIDDVSFSKKLTKIRNGIAHKNAILVSEQLNDGKQTSLSSITQITNKVDSIFYIIRTLELVVKVSDVLRPDMIKNPRFEARFKAYSDILGGMLNFHGEMLVERIPDILKAVILNRLYAPAIILSSEKLGNLLADFKSEVLIYHIALCENNTIKIEEYHEKLSNEIEEINNEMKSHLNIDADYDFFSNHKPATLMELKQYLEQELKKESKNNTNTY